jgi:Cadherin-like
MPKYLSPAARFFIGLGSFALFSACLIAPLVKSDPLPGNAVPVLGANIPLSVGKGQTAVISNTYLRTDDPDSPILTYTLTGLPAHGTLSKNNIALTPGAQFTQQDIDSGALRYSHNNNSATSDKFIFTVSDSPAITPLVRISVGSGGVQSNGSSLVQDISADGRFIYFLSTATNIVGGDTNGFTDAFVYDRQSGQNSRVSLSSLNAQAVGGNTSPGRLSANGRFVTFYSGATNLVPGDTNARNDVFVRDRQLDQTVRVSVSSAGGEGNGNAGRNAISADGNLVVFSSQASNLIPGDTNSKADIFLHKPLGAATRTMIASSPPFRRTVNLSLSSRKPATSWQAIATKLPMFSSTM